MQLSWNLMILRLQSYPTWLVCLLQLCYSTMYYSCPLLLTALNYSLSESTVVLFSASHMLAACLFACLSFPQ